MNPIKCKRCKKIFSRKEFEDNNKQCIHCYVEGNYTILCSEPNCKREVAAGHKTIRGYILTCIKHVPKDSLTTIEYNQYIKKNENKKDI
jgi:hypothetical protein